MVTLSLAIYEESELQLAGRIVSTRVEFLTLATVAPRYDQASIRVLGALTGIIHGSLDHTAPVSSWEEHANEVTPLFVVERRRNKAEQDLITRYYTLDENVVTFLSSQIDDGLVEDGELCRFALSALSPQAAVDPLTFYLQRIRPLESENAILRQALGLAKDEPFRDVDLLKRKGTRSTPQHRGSAVGGSSTTALYQRGGSSLAMSVADQSTQTDPKTAAVPTPAADAFSVHSPLQWEQETDAAINARTKYEPFRSHSPSNRRLDLFTQQHLVVRLHDQSIDMLRARRTSPTRDEETERRILSQDEQRDLGERLHDAQQKHTAKILEDLKAQHKPNTAAKTVMNAEEIKASNERIYKEPMERKKNNMEKLLQKYVFDEEEKLSKVKLSLERQKAMADRLSSKK